MFEHSVRCRQRARFTVELINLFRVVTLHNMSGWVYNSFNKLVENPDFRHFFRIVVMAFAITSDCNIYPTSPVCMVALYIAFRLTTCDAASS